MTYTDTQIMVHRLYFLTENGAVITNYLNLNSQLLEALTLHMLRDRWDKSNAVFRSNIQDRQHSSQCFFDILILFWGEDCSVSWKSPMGDYQIFD